MSLNTGPLVMSMYYLIILFISVLYETTELPEAKEIIHVGISNSLGCCSSRTEGRMAIKWTGGFCPFWVPHWQVHFDKLNWELL